MVDVSTTYADRVRLDIANGVATISLVREARLNAIDTIMHEALSAALDAIGSDPSVRALVLAGLGRAFSAGQDLNERAASFSRGEIPDLRASLQDNYNPLIRAIASSPLPVIAAVNGMAFGAGAALAIACDIVLCAASAKFQFGFINVGLGPDSGASWSLPRLIGQARALDLALTGRAVAAEEALAMGLVSRVVADEQLQAVAHEMAQALTARSPEAVATIKHQLRANPQGSLHDALDCERDAQAVLGRTDFYREAVLRFGQPRSETPFTGQKP